MGRRTHVSCGLCPAVVVLNPYSDHYAGWVRIYVHISTPFPDGEQGTTNFKSDIDLCPVCKSKDIAQHVGEFIEQNKCTVLNVRATKETLN